MSNNPFGEVIFSYTRKQAIADGILVDLSQFEVTRSEWRLHVACTDTVWNIIDAAVKNDRKDYEGVLHDIYTMTRLAVSEASNTDTIHFKAIVGRTVHDFRMHCGPGDDATPVLTLMLSHEDWLAKTHTMGAAVANMDDLIRSGAKSVVEEMAKAGFLTQRKR